MRSSMDALRSELVASGRVIPPSTAALDVPSSSHPTSEIPQGIPVNIPLTTPSEETSQGPPAPTPGMIVIPAPAGDPWARLLQYRSHPTFLEQTMRILRVGFIRLRLHWTL